MVKPTVSTSRKRKKTKESETMKKRKLSLNKKRKAGSVPEGNCMSKISKQTIIGCPVCKDGQEFEGRGHQCTICKRFVHPFCASNKDVDGYGKKVICNDCKSLIM
jgi:hypothetical protein